MNKTRIVNFFKKYGHIWTLSYAFLYLPWFAYLERTVTRRYHVMHSQLDDLIPQRGRQLKLQHLRRRPTQLRCAGAPVHPARAE